MTVCVVLCHCGPSTWNGGIRAQLVWSPHEVRVVEVPVGSAARAAGLAPGDRLLAVDGVPVAGLPAERVHALLSGEVGSVVTLSVQRDESRLSIRVERAPYTRDKARKAW